MRYSHRRSVTLTLILLAALATAGVSEQKAADHGIFPADSVKFEAGPPSLASGAKFAVLEGDPGKEGLFTMRLWLPDGFQIKPHWHPAVEHITVVSGTFHLGMGDAFDTAKTKALPAGAFAFMAPKMNHFAWAKGDTVVQLHGVGPWQINYLDPADDPRKKP
ncbi:MAG TPA: cupin domain-containing protein [Thermoanaerobaculia bacterium]|nr:cupin domain-containing protein [Thermoanaerobaculia bacterium]